MLDVADVSQPLLRILGEAAEQQPSNGGGRRGGQGRPVGLALENLRDRVRDGLTGKREAAGQHLVEHAAERPDVGALVDALTARLLRAHVGGGAEDRAVARLGQVRDARRRRVAAFARPKSSTFTTPSGVILMFAGFRSRWTMPFSCAASSASAICRAMASASSSGRPRPRGRSVGATAALRARSAFGDPLRERLAFDQFQDQRRARRPPLRRRRSRRCADDSAWRASAPRARSARAVPGRP